MDDFQKKNKKLASQAARAEEVWRRKLKKNAKKVKNRQKLKKKKNRSKIEQIRRSFKYKNLRLSTIQKAGGRCMLCGAYEESLIMHHLIMAKDDINKILNGKNVIAICKICHAEIHPWLRKAL